MKRLTVNIERIAETLKRIDLGGSRHLSEEQVDIILREVDADDGTMDGKATIVDDERGNYFIRCEHMALDALCKPTGNSSWACGQGQWNDAGKVRDALYGRLTVAKTQLNFGQEKIEQFVNGLIFKNLETFLSLPADVLWRIVGASDRMGDRSFSWDKVVRNNWSRTAIIDNPFIRYPIGAMDVLGQTVERTTDAILQIGMGFTNLIGYPRAPQNYEEWGQLIGQDLMLATPVYFKFRQSTPIRIVNTGEEVWRPAASENSAYPAVAAETPSVKLPAPEPPPVALPVPRLAEAPVAPEAVAKPPAEPTAAVASVCEPAIAVVAAAPVGIYSRLSTLLKSLLGTPQTTPLDDILAYDNFPADTARIPRTMEMAKAILNAKAEELEVSSKDIHVIVAGPGSNAANEMQVWLSLGAKVTVVECDGVTALTTELRLRRHGIDPPNLKSVHGRMESAAIDKGDIVVWTHPLGEFNGVPLLSTDLFRQLKPGGIGIVQADFPLSLRYVNPFLNAGHEILLHDAHVDASSYFMPSHHLTGTSSGLIIFKDWRPAEPPVVEIPSPELPPATPVH